MQSATGSLGRISWRVVIRLTHDRWLGGIPPPNRQHSGTFAGSLGGQSPALRRASNCLSMNYNCQENEGQALCRPERPIPIISSLIRIIFGLIRIIFSFLRIIFGLIRINFGLIRNPPFTLLREDFFLQGNLLSGSCVKSMSERDQTARQRVRCRVSRQAGRLLTDDAVVRSLTMSVKDTFPSLSTPTTPDGPASAAAKAVELIAQQYRDAIAGLQAIIPLLKFVSRQTRRVAASAKFASALIEPTIAMVTSASLAKERNLFNVYDGEFALELCSQITPLFQQLASLAA